MHPGKDAGPERGRIVGTPAEQTSTGVTERTKTGLRTGKKALKTGRIVGSHCLRGRNVVGTKS